MSAVFAIGDPHGCYEQSVQLLREHNFIDGDLSWNASDATVCFMGDYVDHGPDGLACVDLVMHLQREAAAVGGRVIALLGNHEPMLLAAHRFGERTNPLLKQTFSGQWLDKDGVPDDLARLTPAHVTWLSRLPAMALVAERLLLHADAPFYAEHGNSVVEVNRSLANLLQGEDVAVWARLIEQFSEHHAFRSDGARQARQFLQTFGGRQIVHGHTPICKMTGQPMHEITQPLVYADGLCVNVDHGLYLGGPGFVYRVTSDQ